MYLIVVKLIKKFIKSYMVLIKFIIRDLKIYRHESSPIDIKYWIKYILYFISTLTVTLRSISCA
jgi:hypothetical protein